MTPREIEEKSMAIIESELHAPLPEETAPVVKRVIHATADFSFAESLRFTPGVVPLMRDMLSRGASVVTDTQMALAGIRKPSLERAGAKAFCFVADEDVAREAEKRGVTRSSVAMERALLLPAPRLLVCGNALGVHGVIRQSHHLPRGLRRPSSSVRPEDMVGARAPPRWPCAALPQPRQGPPRPPCR